MIQSGWIRRSVRGEQPPAKIVIKLTIISIFFIVSCLSFIDHDCESTGSDHCFSHVRRQVICGKSKRKVQRTKIKKIIALVQAYRDDLSHVYADICQDVLFHMQRKQITVQERQIGVSQ